MRPAKLTALVLASLLAGDLAAAPVRAAPSKVWVSDAGGDSNQCGSVMFPCRSFEQAYLNVAAGGEIGVLTPGDYAGFQIFNINKSVNVSNDGAGEASILGSTGIYINAGVGDVVTLRGLTVDGQISGEAGIAIFRASALHIQNCVIRNFESPRGGFGLIVQPVADMQVFVSDSIIFNNGSLALNSGIFVAPQGTARVRAVLDRVHLENNVVGLRADGSIATGSGIQLIIRDSVVSGNAGDGIHAFTAPGRAPAFILVERTTSVNNAGTGISANGAGVTMLLDDDSVTRNAVGISAVNGGQLISYGNNRVNNNIGPDGTPTGHFGPI